MINNARQERQIIGSGTTWIPLSRDLTHIVKMYAIAEKLLGNRSPYAKDANGDSVNTWQKDNYGIVYRNGSAKFQVLVCRHEDLGKVERGLTDIHNRIKADIGLVPDTDLASNTQSSSKSQSNAEFSFTESLGIETNDLEHALNAASKNSDIQPIIDEICNLLAPSIAYGVVDGYNINDQGNGNTIQSFIERHYSRRVPLSEIRKDDKDSNRYTFEHTHQLVSDTSDESGNNNSSVRLRSVPIPGAPSERVSESSLWKQPQSDPAGAELVPNAMPKSKAVAIEVLGNPQNPEKRTVGEPTVRVDPPSAMMEVDSTNRELRTIKISEKPEVPLKTEGGAGNRSADTFDNNHVGTRHGTTTSGGEADNPMSHLPSAAFLPNTTWLSSIFAGPIAFFQDPGAAFAVIGIVTLLQSDEEDEISYVQKYKTLPSMLIDNQTVDDNLFGEGAGYALGLGPTPDIGQPETQE